jgi:hypothetical protein
MAQWAVRVNLVVITTSITHLGKHPAILKLPDYALDRAFGYTNPCGNVPQSGRRVLRKAHQYMCVVAEKRPGMLYIQGSRPSSLCCQVSLTPVRLPTIVTR